MALDDPSGQHLISWKFLRTNLRFLWGRENINLWRTVPSLTPGLVDSLDVPHKSPKPSQFWNNYQQESISLKIYEYIWISFFLFMNPSSIHLFIYPSIYLSSIYVTISPVGFFLFWGLWLTFSLRGGKHVGLLYFYVLQLCTGSFLKKIIC